MRRRRGALALAAAALVVAIGACGNGDASGPGAGNRPRLPWRGGTGSDAMLYSDEGDGTPDSAPPLRRARFEVADGVTAASSAPAYRFDGAATGWPDVQRVAKALGLAVPADEPTERWKVRDGDRVLIVRQEGAGYWEVLRGERDRCIALDKCSEPRWLPDLPTDDEAATIARTFAAAIGFEDVEIALVWDAPDGRVGVTVVPRLGGLRVPGLAMVVSLGSGGRIERGTGQLATPSLIAEYPLLSPAETYQRFRSAVPTGDAERIQLVDAEVVLATVLPTSTGGTTYLVPAIELSDGGVNLIGPVVAVRDEDLEEGTE